MRVFMYALPILFWLFAASPQSARADDVDWNFDKRVASLEKKVSVLEKQVKALRDANYVENQKTGGTGVVSGPTTRTVKVCENGQCRLVQVEVPAARRPVSCFNCDTCGDNCTCFGGGYYCNSEGSGACPVQTPAPAAKAPQNASQATQPPVRSRPVAGFFHRVRERFARALLHGW